MQEFMKDLIIWVNNMGIGDLIYYSFHVMDFISVIALALWMGPKLNIGRLRTVLIVLIIYPILYVWMLVQYWIESGFRYFGGQHLVSMFIWVPLVGILAAKILKLEWKTACFYLAPCMPLIQTVGHLGCVFAGCCHGYPVENGLYNIVYDGYYFPIQPIESFVAFLIVVCLLYRAKKLKYVPDAKQYPIMMILYGSTRFICEFFRMNEKLLWGCSKLAFHALFMCVVGIVAMVVIENKTKAEHSNT